MSHILIAALSVCGLAAVLFLCLKYGEPVVRMLGGVPMAGAPELTSSVPAGEPEEPAPAPRAGMPVATAEAFKSRFERYPDRRVETAARLLVAEIEEYLAGKADSR
jgi:hypothetical protein